MTSGTFARRRLTAALAGFAVAVGGAAVPARAQTPAADREILPPALVRDLEQVIEEAVVVAAESARQSIAAIDLDRTIRHALEARPGAAQNRGRIERSDRSTRTVALGANGLLDLRNVSGDITVTAGGGRDVVIEILEQSRASNESDAALGLKEVEVAIDHRGERAIVETRYPRRRTPYDVTTSYVVTAPAGTRLNARSVSGDIVVRGLKGDLTVNTVSGTIRVNDAGRISEARSVSGSVTLADVTTDGAVNSGTVSGDIELTRLRAVRVTAENVSGRIRADGVTSDGVLMKSLSGTVDFSGPLSRNGRYELQSHSGTVRLAVTGTVGFELQAQSFSGRIRPEGLSLQSISMNRGALRATVGDGSAVVIATTFSGDVVVGRK